MPVDYGEVLKDLDAQIASLEAEVATLRAARPTIVLLRNKYSPPLAAPVSKSGIYSTMGPTNAIPLVLKGEPFPLLTSQIADKLQAGGVKSQATDFPASVSATLGQLRDKGIVEKVGDGWKLKTNNDEVTVSFPAPNSLAATLLYPNADVRRSEQ
jgi:hypothetical protein